MKQSIRITSRVNKRLYADAIPGHFATNHSHINYYIDMSEIKHSMAMSREAARSIAYQFSSTSIDTLLCMEGTEYIGAYLAGELSSVGMGNVNSGKDIYLVEPDSNVNGQFVFSDNLRHMIEHRNAAWSILHPPVRPSRRRRSASSITAAASPALRRCSPISAS
ncbi:MAG: hypothetical protein ACLT4C_05995 [Butyricicoccus sp.]